MDYDIGLGCICFDFCRGAALHCWVCRLWSENDSRQQSVNEPEPMSSLWQYGLCSFQTGGTKLEIFLPKNQQSYSKEIIEVWELG